jgi:argininosuccinate synthase
MTGGLVPMAMTLSRPLIAQRLAEIARIERADAVAHTGRGIDGSSRLDQLLAAIAPGLRIVTPAAEWALAGADLEAFASRHGLASDDATRVDANLWGRSLPYQGGAAPTSLVAKATDACPAEPAFVDITFTKGVPTALNGVALPLIELVSSLGTLASRHGVGHVSAAGLLCDAPAAVLLHAAHRDLTDAASTADLQRFLALATEAYVGVIEGGRWFSPLREALDACFAAAQSRVNGHVRLRLLKGDYSTIATELSRPDVLSRLPLVPSYAQH